MFIPSEQGATASTTVSATEAATPFASATSAATTSAIPREQVRHMLFGTLPVVQSSIRHLHKLGYAEPNDWSRPMSTGRANEVMAILTKRIGQCESSSKANMAD